MSHYIHHVPGRMRVRSRSLRCGNARLQAAIEQLQALDGVREVRLNRRGGSITLHYDPQRRCHLELLGLLEEAGCIGAQRRHQARAAGGGAEGLLGRALAGAFANAVAQRSVQSLVGALL